MNPAWNARSKDFNDNAFRFKFHFAPLVFIHLHGNVAVGHPKISSTYIAGKIGGTGAQYIFCSQLILIWSLKFSWQLGVYIVKIMNVMAGDLVDFETLYRIM